MKRTVQILLLIVFWLGPTISIAQKTLPDELIESIEKRVHFGYNPSIVVGIVDEDGPRYFTFGTKSIGGDPVDEHTIYEIGSVTKVFTAILLAET